MLSETFVLDQIDMLAGAGLPVEVVAAKRNTNGLLHEKGQKLAATATYAEDHMRFSASLPGFVRRRLLRPLLVNAYRKALQGADLVLSHFGPNAQHAAYALKNDAHCRLWSIFHGYDLSSYIVRHGPNVYEPLFARGDRFFAVSRIWMTKLEQLGCPPERIGLLRTGIDVEQIAFRNRRDLAGRPLRFLSVCRLVEKKGLEFGLLAVSELTRKRPDLDWSYEIVGDGPLRRNLERLAVQLGIRSRVVFAGKVSSAIVQAKLDLCDVFLLPSITASDGDMEGIPVSLMEAMAAGIPVLSTFHSGIPELIEHRETGLLAPERDFLSLARNLEDLLDQPELLSSLTRAARRWVEREFNQRIITQKLAEDIRREFRAPEK